MIWLTWRQFRAQALSTAACLAVLAAVLAITGPHLAHLYATSGLTSCRAHGDCSTLSSEFLDRVKAEPVYPALYFTGIGVLLAAPGLIGIFWGAPLVAREIEAGTFRLVWTQSVSRTRWLAVKLALTGLAAMAATALLSLVITWWSSPVFRTGVSPGNLSYLNRFSPLVFAASGITPVGYAAFAFVLGVIAGVFARRIAPAMAVTLGIFTLVQIIVPSVVRPHYPITPARATATITAGFLDTSFIGFNNGQMILPLNIPGALVNLPGALILSNQAITPAGHVFVLPSTDCQAGTVQQCMALIASNHLRQLVIYQPASHYWPFQWCEAAIFLALALALAGFGIWWIRHRRLTT